MSPIPTHSLTLSTLLKYAGAMLIVLVFLVYVAFQARLVIYGPTIALVEEPAAVQNEQQITLRGTANNIVKITMNDREIVTNEEGYFEEQIVLENGYNVMKIQAHDRYGRSKTLTREFVFTPLSYLTRN